MIPASGNTKAPINAMIARVFVGFAAGAAWYGAGAGGVAGGVASDIESPGFSSGRTSSGVIIPLVSKHVNYLIGISARGNNADLIQILNLSDRQS